MAIVKNTSNSSDVMGKSLNSTFYVQVKAFVLSHNKDGLFKIPNISKTNTEVLLTTVYNVHVFNRQLFGLVLLYASQFFFVEKMCFHFRYIFYMFMEDV